MESVCSTTIEFLFQSRCCTYVVVVAFIGGIIKDSKVYSTRSSAKIHGIWWGFFIGGPGGGCGGSFPTTPYPLPPPGAAPPLPTCTGRFGAGERFSV